MKSIPHVALLIETSREYARGLLRGVARYNREHGPWSVYFEPHGLRDPPPTWLAGWKGDGILARIDDRRMADAILKTGIPAVDVRGALPKLGVPFIGVDNRPVSQLGVQHLIECGLRNFAFCGTARGENPNQDLRCDYFVEYVRAEGHDCDVFCCRRSRDTRYSWEKQQQDIAEWLQQLPKPVGVMTCHDDLGQSVLDACRRAELAVPDEVAIIGVDNDPVLCNLCSPPLSSIDVNPSRIGYQAAILLGELMNGGKPPVEPLLLGPPRGIANRQSTNTLWVEDQEVAKVIRFVREHACEGIGVPEVLANARGSRSTLERRVKKILGRTIKEEITRVQLSRARLLLSETEWTVAKISQQCGFSEPKYFCEIFRKHAAMTATEFRRRFRDD
jgi:LacI family transcriptional regulator